MLAHWKRNCSVAGQCQPKILLQTLAKIIKIFTPSTGSKWSILLTKNVAFVNVIDRVGNYDKKY